MICKFCSDDYCDNLECPAWADVCPCKQNYFDICKFAELEREKLPVTKEDIEDYKADIWYGLKRDRGEL